jgi:uncharacterized membrane protein
MTTIKVPLDTAASHVLEECRMVLPGIQALFGFQLVAVFTQPFAERLTQAEQRLHFLSILLIVTAIALVMAPVAIHRRTQLGTLHERFVGAAARLLLASMFPLALAICLDVYLVARLIFEDRTLSGLVAAGLLALFAALWLLLPRRYSS